MVDRCFSSDETLRVASVMASEAVDLLPDGMKEAAALAFQAVISHHCDDFKVSEEKLRKLRSISYSREAYSYFLSAKNEYALSERINSDNPENRKHIAKVKAALSQYLASDLEKRPYEEIIEARLLKARADFILGRRKGIFMGIVEIGEDQEADQAKLEGLKLRGLHTEYVSEHSVFFSRKDGSLFAVSLEAPGMLVVAGVNGDGEIMECADFFIKLAASSMQLFSASSFYINGVMLSDKDIEEALRDISEGAFPVWFFARGYELDESGRHVMVAEGAESFGVKAIKIVDVKDEDREDASNALSLILVYQVYSVSARRSRSFTIGEKTYSLVSSDKDSVSFILEKK